MGQTESKTAADGTSMTFKDARSLMNMVHVSEVAPNRADGTIVVSTTDTVDAVVSTLSNAKILAAPVMNPLGLCIGFVDMLDLCAYSYLQAPDVMDKMPKAAEKFKTTTIQQLFDVLPPGKIFAVQPSDSLYLLCQLFGKGVHRAVVLSKVQGKDEVSTTVSQSDVCRFVYNHLTNTDLFRQKGVSSEAVQALDAITQKPLSELGFEARKVVQIVDTEPIVLALKKLAYREDSVKKISAIAVVDKNGCLVGNLSAADLRGLYVDVFPHYLTSVRDFLQKNSPKSLSPRSVNKDASLILILHIMLTKHLHRLWIVESPENPVCTGVVTMTDVLRVLADASAQQ